MYAYIHTRRVELATAGYLLGRRSYQSFVPTPWTLQWLFFFGFFMFCCKLETKKDIHWKAHLSPCSSSLVNAICVLGPHGRKSWERVTQLHADCCVDFPLAGPLGCTGCVLAGFACFRYAICVNGIVYSTPRPRRLVSHPSFGHTSLSVCTRPRLTGGMQNSKTSEVCRAGPGPYAIC